MHLHRADHVVIVEDEKSLLLSGQVVDQRRDQALERRRRGWPEQRGHPFADPGPRPVQRGHRVTPEPGRVVVPRVQRQPPSRMPAAPGPVRPAGPSCRIRPGHRPTPAPAPGPHQAVPVAAAAARDRAAARACTAWWPAGHSALGPSPSAHPSLTCTALRLRDPPYRRWKNLVASRPAAFPRAVLRLRFHLPWPPASPFSPG